MKKPWKAKEILYLMAEYPNRSTPVIAKRMDRTASAVYQQARKLGLKKSAEYMSTEACGRLQGETGHAHRYPKGNKPWNAGMKGWNPSGSEKGHFKPGQKPQTWKPVGTEKLDKDGLLVRKVADEGPRRQCWKGVHVLVWERGNGPVPAGHIVVFKRGMKTNKLEEITIDRVECISRAENMKRNSYHNYPPEIARTIQLIGAVNRQINKRAKHEQ